MSNKLEELRKQRMVENRQIALQAAAQAASAVGLSGRAFDSTVGTWILERAAEFEDFLNHGRDMGGTA